MDVYFNEILEGRTRILHLFYAKLFTQCGKIMRQNFPMNYPLSI